MTEPPGMPRNWLLIIAALGGAVSLSLLCVGGGVLLLKDDLARILLGGPGYHPTASVTRVTPQPTHILSGQLGCQPTTSVTRATPQPVSRSADVYLVPLGAFERTAATALADSYAAEYDLTVAVLPAIEITPAACDTQREQLIAEEAMQLLGDGYPDLARDANTVVIGLTSEDMYIKNHPSWRFAFSLRSEIGLAVVSDARMQVAASPAVAHTRLRKMVTKNIGVLHFGLPLSDDPHSVLYRDIDSVNDLDVMGEEF